MLLFDIDGTLLLTGGAGRVAIEQSFENVFGVKNVWGNTIPDGKTDPIIFQEIIFRVLQRPYTDEEFQHLYAAYLSYFEEAIKDSPNFRLMPGIKNLLQILSEETHLFLGIQTGNFEQTAWIKLEKAGIRHHFHFGGFGSDSAKRSELVAKGVSEGKTFLQDTIANQDIFVIGDSIHDIQAAKELGLRNIAVATGRAEKRISQNVRLSFFRRFI